jgi:hypothetical protein
MVNGSIFHVTENVFQALLHLRSSNGISRTLWVDAICINQADDIERGHQVQYMGRIYNKATKVTV